MCDDKPSRSRQHEQHDLARTVCIHAQGAALVARLLSRLWMTTKTKLSGTVQYIKLGFGAGHLNLVEQELCCQCPRPDFASRLKEITCRALRINSQFQTTMYKLEDDSECTVFCKCTVETVSAGLKVGRNQRSRPTFSRPHASLSAG